MHRVLDRVVDIFVVLIVFMILLLGYMAIGIDSHIYIIEQIKNTVFLKFLFSRNGTLYLIIIPIVFIIIYEISCIIVILKKNSKQNNIR